MVGGGLNPDIPVVWCPELRMNMDSVPSEPAQHLSHDGCPGHANGMSAELWALCGKISSFHYMVVVGGNFISGLGFY